MLNRAIRGQIDRLRDSLWSGGVSNPLTGVEQLTYLLFIRRLDEVQSREEAKAQALGRPVARTIFPEGTDGLATPGFRKDPDTGEGENGCRYCLLYTSPSPRDS